MADPSQLMIQSNILGTLFCSFCKKYLSVGPVKIYPGGVVKCGRCSKENDNGELSIYNQLVENNFFPCINKYEGCRKALRHFEVLKHEKCCQTTRNNCPVCFVSEDMSAYELLQHFEFQHKHRILEEPKFVLTPGYGNFHYVYCNEFNVIQIVVQKFETQYIKVIAKVLGHTKYVRHITVKFDVSSVYSVITTKNLNTFAIEIRFYKLASNRVTVKFDVNYDGILSNDFIFSPDWYPDNKASCSIVPTTMLETLTCTSCGKYLSVGPVKMYQRGAVKCGRCSKNDPAGVHSLYNWLMTELVFPCVNRYDGCNELLHSSEILNHESLCRSGKPQIYCPICTFSPEMTIFEFLMHFKSHHPSNILKTPTFTLKYFATYIYYNSRHVYKISILPSKKRNIKILVYIFGWAFYDVHILFNLDQKFAITTTSNFKLYESVPINELTIQNEVEFKISYENEENLPIWCYYHGLFRQTNEFNNSFPNSIIRYEADYEDELIMACQNCYGYHRNFYYKTNVDKLICEDCAFIHNSYQSNKNNLNCSETLRKMFSMVGIKCRYGCEGIFNLTFYLESKHDDNCKRRPLQKCPYFESCKWENKLSLLESHFTTEHPGIMLTEEIVFYYQQIDEISNNFREMVIRSNTIFHKLTLKKSENKITCRSRTFDSLLKFSKNDSLHRGQIRLRVDLEPNDCLKICLYDPMESFYFSFSSLKMHWLINYAYD